MTHPLEKFTVRIRAGDKTTVGGIQGGGFLVTEHHVFTCAHVVNDALGRDKSAADFPQEIVYLDFPLVAKEQWIPACVHPNAWYPMRPNEGDIAGLKLLSDLPPDAVPAPLGRTDKVWNAPFATFGYPKYRDDPGVTVVGVIRGGQIEWQGEYAIEPGFSGCPVWDENNKSVVGMVNTAEPARRNIKAAYMIPVDTLTTTWPIIEICYLDSLITKLEAEHRFKSYIELPAVADAALPGTSPKIQVQSRDIEDDWGLPELNLVVRPLGHLTSRTKPECHLPGYTAHTSSPMWALPQLS